MRWRHSPVLSIALRLSASVMLTIKQQMYDMLLYLFNNPHYNNKVSEDNKNGEP